ncbi:MAG: hypothetical protein ACPGR8_08565 [Limisphaerales bacterium]
MTERARLAKRPKERGHSCPHTSSAKRLAKRFRFVTNCSFVPE